jgi:hypothetical protein
VHDIAARPLMLSKIPPIALPSTPLERLHDDVGQARELLALLWQARVDRDSWVKRWRLLIYLQRAERRIRGAIENGELPEFPVERLRSILALLSKSVPLAHVIADSARDGVAFSKEPLTRLCTDLDTEARQVNDEALIVSGGSRVKQIRRATKISPRDKYIFRRYNAGDPLKEIRAAIDKTAWERIYTDQGISAVVKRVAAALGEPPSRRRSARIQR